MTSDKPVLLLTYDGSEVSKAAFTPAARLTKLMQGQLIIVRVLQPPPAIWSHPDAAYREAELAKLGENAQADVEAAASELARAEGIEARGEARPLGTRWNVAGEIIAAAEENGAELICMATHGEGGIRRLVLGSTSHEVLAESHRPVVLIRAGHDA